MRIDRSFVGRAAAVNVHVNVRQFRCDGGGLNGLYVTAAAAAPTADCAAELAKLQ